MGLPGFIRHDIGIKIASLALAVFLWVSVAERREVELTVDLPLRYTNMPPDMTFAAPVPKEAAARIIGKGKFLRWKLDDVYFAIDLSPAGAGMVTHVVSPSEVVIPPEKEIEVLEVLEPRAIRVELDRIVTREVPIAVQLRGELPEDKVIMGKARSEPEVVVVDGPEKLVGPLDSVRTEPVDLGQLAKKERVEARVDMRSLPYVSVDIERVDVGARLEDRKELGIPAVPIHARVRTGEKLKFTPDSLDVVISGAESHVDSLDPQELELALDVSDLPKGQLIFRPVVREGRLYFEVRTAGKPEEIDRVFEVRCSLEAPYDFDIVSVSPDEIGFVKR
jgi:hypothetical protein